MVCTICYFYDNEYVYILNIYILILHIFVIKANTYYKMKLYAAWKWQQHMLLKCQPRCPVMLHGHTCSLYTSFWCSTLSEASSFSSTLAVAHQGYCTQQLAVVKTAWWLLNKNRATTQEQEPQTKVKASDKKCFWYVSSTFGSMMNGRK